jgi:hypothetical protein
MLPAAVGRFKNRDLTLRHKRGQAFQPGQGMASRFAIAQSTVAMRRWGPPTIVTLAAMALLTASTAEPMDLANMRSGDGRAVLRAMLPNL